MVAVSRETVLAEVEQHKVRFLDHRRAAALGVTNLAAWAPLFGYKLFAETVWVTMRPWIIHPIGIDEPLDHWEMIAHELVHYGRQPSNRLGVLLWIAKYGLSNKRRAIEEMEAHVVDIIVGRVTRNIPALVDRMVSWYRIKGVDKGWMCDYMAQRLHEVTNGL